MIDKKISSVFLEFIDPILDESVEAGTKGFESVIKMAWSVWNAVISNDLEGDPTFLSKVKSIPDPYQVIEKLIERKRTEFSEYQYKLGQHEVRKKPDGSYSLFLEAKESKAARVQ